jgi:formylmethanofuran dehydrogenase subunit D
MTDRRPPPDSHRLPLTLISGRTTTQGKAVHKGKHSAEYDAEVRTIEMNAADLEARGLADGDPVRLRSRFGEVRLKVKKADLPVGLVFVAYGYPVNQVIGGDTQGTGMPDSKGLDVEVERLAPPAP